MLGIIVVTYKAVDETVNYVRQELRKVRTPHKIVIVNVAASDETNTCLTEKLSACYVSDVDMEIDTSADIYVLGQPDNLGYAKGNNLGAGFLFKHFDDVDYLLITNTDIQLVDADVVERLIIAADADHRIGAVGPRVVDPQGRYQTPLRALSIWRFLVLPKLLPMVKSLHPAIRAYYSPLGNAGVSGRVDEVVGAFFLVKSRAFREAHGFDSWTFLYCEEAILSKRLSSCGYSVYYVADTRVVHEHQKGTWTDIRCERRREWILFHSRVYYYTRYHGVGPVARAAAYLSMIVFLYAWLPLHYVLRRIMPARRTCPVSGVSLK